MLACAAAAASSYRNGIYWFEAVAMLRKSSIVVAEVLLSTAEWQVRWRRGSTALAGW